MGLDLIDEDFRMHACVNEQLLQSTSKAALEENACQVRSAQGAQKQQCALFFINQNLSMVLVMVVD